MDRNDGNGGTTPDFTGDYTRYTEWRAWQLVVSEFRKLGIDINDPRYNALIRCIEAWAELLVELRMGQSEFERDEARRVSLMMALRAVRS